MINFDGYHGTDNAHVRSILTYGLKPSIGNSHWLGDGVYFFIQGKDIHPDIQAMQWSILSAWDKSLHMNKYKKYSVLKAEISVEDSRFLDLTGPSGLEILSYIKDKCMEKLKKLPAKVKFIDGYLINLGRTEIGLNIDVVKGDVFIQLTKEDRMFKLCSRIPNCTISSVFNTACISNISNIKTGLV